MTAQDVLPGLDQLSEGFAIFDRELKLVFCNKPFLRMYDLSASVAKPAARCVRFLSIASTPGF